jgi:deazaflavin-dependent oxidoreductase (nitroreductase family)
MIGIVEVLMPAESALRRIFWYFNRFFMVPMFRLGLGSFVGNPVSGYIMVIKTTGRKTGKVRYVPLNYAIINGSVYCLAGYGRLAHWYRNLSAQPRVEVILPGNTISGIAEDVTDGDERLIAIRQILINGGIPGLLLGVNPRSVSDEVLLQKAEGLPVIRIRPSGIANGPADAGGWLWIVVCVLSLVWLFRLLRHQRD